MPTGRLAAVTNWSAEHSWPWLLAGALIYLSFGFTEMMGSDLWWHLAAGREIVQNGSVWLFDDWSYTELGSPWHNHEWLSDLLFYGWASAFGVPSLVVWKWLLIVATFCSLQQLLTRTAGNAPAALLASVLAAAIAAPFLDMRPQLYSLLAIVLLLHLAWQRTPRLIELLPLFLVWANLHGGFVFGLMLLGILLFPWQDLSLPALRKAAVSWFACAAVCLINPDGIRIFWLPLVYALNDSSPYRSLAEWRSPFEAGGIRSSLYSYSLLVAAALVMSWLLPTVRRAVSFRPEVLAFVLLTAAMSATSRRFIILWAIAFAVLLAPFAAALLRQRFVRPFMLPVLLALACWGLLRLTPYPLQPRVAYHYLTAEFTYPHDLVNFAEINGLHGNTFAYYNWGGYLHWRGDGALKVFLDGRANTLFDDATYLEYVAVLAGRQGAVERIEASGAELVLWLRNRGGVRLIKALEESGRWIQLYQDTRGVLLARRDFALPPTLRLPRHSVESELTAAYIAMRSADYESALAAASRAHALRPWDQAACSWLKQSLQAAGRPADAEAVIRGCRNWFPSKYLR